MAYLILSHPMGVDGEPPDDGRKTNVYRRPTLEKARALVKRINSNSKLKRWAEIQEEEIPTRQDVSTSIGGPGKSSIYL